MQGTCPNVQGLMWVEKHQRTARKWKFCAKNPENMQTSSIESRNKPSMATSTNYQVSQGVGKISSMLFDVYSLFQQVSLDPSGVRGHWNNGGSGILNGISSSQRTQCYLLGFSWNFSVEHVDTRHSWLIPMKSIHMNRRPITSRPAIRWHNTPLVLWQLVGWPKSDWGEKQQS